MVPRFSYKQTLPEPPAPNNPVSYVEEAFAASLQIFHRHLCLSRFALFRDTRNCLYLSVPPLTLCHKREKVKSLYKSSYI